jgi:hypothetical protein
MSKAEPRANLRDYVLNAIDAIVRRAQVMSCKYGREEVGSPMPSQACAGNQLMTSLHLNSPLPLSSPSCFLQNLDEPQKDSMYRVQSGSVTRGVQQTSGATVTLEGR